MRWNVLNKLMSHELEFLQRSQENHILRIKFVTKINSSLLREGGHTWLFSKIELQWRSRVTCAFGFPVWHLIWEHTVSRTTSS